MDKLDLLRIFVRIADTGSISAAARSLGMSQPSASRQLRTLESMFGTQLAARSTQQFSLTSAGEQLLRKARTMLAEWESVSEEMRAAQGGFNGVIRAAGPMGLGQTILAELASDFLLENPGVTLEWHVASDLGGLAAADIDVFIQAAPVRDTSLIVHALWPIPRVLVCAACALWLPACPSDPSALSQLPFVILTPYVTPDLILTGPQGQTTTLHLRPVFTTDNSFAAMVATERGVGFGVMPLWRVAADLKTGKLVHLCPRWSPSALTLYVAYPQDRFRPIRIVAFIEHLRRNISIKLDAFANAG